MSQEKEKEIQQLKNRFRDLAEKSFRQNMFTFSGFLGLNEQDIFWQTEQELRYAGCLLFGGIENTDRQMIRFGNPEELGYEIPFPIVCVHIKPLIAKFADKLSHRDFLGALMNLGIERDTIGDIKVGDKEAYLFCTETIADFICENLTQIKHTHVKCIRNAEYKELPEEKPEIQLLQVASLRVDVVIAKVYRQSRGDCLELFKAGKVFVNGRLCENNAKILRQGDVVNARGFGKFLFVAEKGETKKGKINAEVAVYR